MDYFEHRDSLLALLHKYREVIALPGATDKAEHHIKLKPETKPVYIPAYRLPHSLRQIVDKQIKDMLKQSVIQPLRSLWNSLLFLVTKKDGQFQHVRF